MSRIVLEIRTVDDADVRPGAHDALVDRLDSIDHKLNLLLANDASIIRKERQIMTIEKQLQDDMDALQQAVVDVLTVQTAQVAQIAALKAQIDAGTPVTQEQLDALDGQAQTILGTLRAVAQPPSSSNATGAF